MSSLLLRLFTLYESHLQGLAVAMPWQTVDAVGTAALYALRRHQRV